MKKNDKVNFYLFGCQHEAVLIEKQNNKEWKVLFEGLVYPDCKVLRKSPKSKPPPWFIIHP